jgi:cytochrome b561
MFRKLVAIVLFVSFIAMSTSGLLMFVVDKTSFTLQMHPVHKLFGLLLVLAALCHITLNIRSLRIHLKARAVALSGGMLVAALVALYALALGNRVPVDTATKLDELAHQAEQQLENGDSK